MKIEITMPERYKNYMIVGVAIEVPSLKWWRLSIYSKSGKELKQIEPKHATLSDKTTAQLDELQLIARLWIQRSMKRAKAVASSAALSPKKFLFSLNEAGE